MASRTRLLNKLKHVNNSYDIVVIDTPPSRDIYAEVALITADYLIIPSDLKPFANQGLPTVKNFIKDINENRSTFGREPIELLGVLASKISTNARFIQYTFPKQREVIGKRYEMPLMESVIYDRTALSESFNKTIVVGDIEYPDPKSIFKYADEVNSSAQTSAMEFEILANEVLTKIGLK
jgi:chromosome partitioning protein